MLAPHPLKATVAAALALAAAVPAAASARPALDSGNPTTTTTTSQATPIVRIVTPKSLFDWGDAGIGAAGGLALSLLGLGGALALSHQHTRRS